MLFAYFGPETTLPLTSALAGLVGLVLMFGRGTIAAMRRGISRMRSGRQAAGDGASSPWRAARPELRVDGPQVASSERPMNAAATEKVAR